MNWKIGDVTITLVREMQTAVTLDGMFIGADQSVVDDNSSWLQPHFVNDDGTLPLSIHALVLESQGSVIVVDTCIGDRPVPGFDALSNLGTSFLADLAAAGFDPDDVDIVLCTHLHFDHVGWNTQLVNGKWVPTFPNARYLFGRTEYEHWKLLNDTHGYHDLGHIADAVQPVIDAGLVDFIEADHRICPELSLMPTPGHTPGHVSVVIESKGERAVITGDMMHHPIQFERPGDIARFDMNQQMAAQTRESFVDKLANSGTYVIGSHFNEPTGGFVVRDSHGCRLIQK